MIVPTIPVSDLERARTFDGETLGLELLWENAASIRFRVGSTSEVSTFKRPGLTTTHMLAHSRSPTSRPPSTSSRRTV